MSFQVTKNRFDGELGLMLLKFDKESLSFAAKEKEKPAPKKSSENEEEIKLSHPFNEDPRKPVDEKDEEEEENIEEDDEL